MGSQTPDFAPRFILVAVPLAAALAVATSLSGSAGEAFARPSQAGGRSPYDVPHAPMFAGATDPVMVGSVQHGPGLADDGHLDVLLDRRLASSTEPPDLPASRELSSGSGWCWRLLPEGLIYRSYLAGMKESRFATKWLYEQNEGWIWDTTLGGRLGFIRYGSADVLWPQGWQLDVEGAAQPRLDPEEDLDMTVADFRIGLPLTYGRGPYQMKLAWYHMSSHLGDEFMLKNPGVPRINYSRDAIIWGHSFYPTDDLRLYVEAEWAYYTDGGNEPWEFQFGIDYYRFDAAGQGLVPFFAVNGHLREAVDFGGNLSIQTGWLHRGASGQLFRMGLQYYAGKSDQYEFFNRYEDKIGLGIWYDF